MGIFTNTSLTFPCLLKAGFIILLCTWTNKCEGSRKLLQELSSKVHTGSNRRHLKAKEFNLFGSNNGTESIRKPLQDNYTKTAVTIENIYASDILPAENEIGKRMNDHQSNDSHTFVKDNLSGEQTLTDIPNNPQISNNISFTVQNTTYTIHLNNFSEKELRKLIDKKKTNINKTQSALTNILDVKTNRMQERLKLETVLNKNQQKISNDQQMSNNISFTVNNTTYTIHLNNFSEKELRKLNKKKRTNINKTQSALTNILDVKTNHMQERLKLGTVLNKNEQKISKKQSSQIPFKSTKEKLELKNSILAISPEEVFKVEEQNKKNGDDIHYLVINVTETTEKEEIGKKPIKTVSKLILPDIIKLEINKLVNTEENNQQEIHNHQGHSRSMTVLGSNNAKQVKHIHNIQPTTAVHNKHRSINGNVTYTTPKTFTSNYKQVQNTWTGKQNALPRNESKTNASKILRHQQTLTRQDPLTITSTTREAKLPDSNTSIFKKVITNDKLGILTKKKKKLLKKKHKTKLTLLKSNDGGYEEDMIQPVAPSDYRNILSNLPNLDDVEMIRIKGHLLRIIAQIDQRVSTNAKGTGQRKQYLKGRQNSVSLLKGKPNHKPHTSQKFGKDINGTSKTEDSGNGFTKHIPFRKALDSPSYVRKNSKFDNLRSENNVQVNRDNHHTTTPLMLMSKQQYLKNESKKLNIKQQPNKNVQSWEPIGVQQEGTTNDVTGRLELLLKMSKGLLANNKTAYPSSFKGNFVTQLGHFLKSTEKSEIPFVSTSLLEVNEDISQRKIENKTQSVQATRPKQSSMYVKSSVHTEAKHPGLKEEISERNTSQNVLNLPNSKIISIMDKNMSSDSQIQKVSAQIDHLKAILYANGIKYNSEIISNFSASKFLSDPVKNDTGNSSRNITNKTATNTLKMKNILGKGSNLQKDPIATKMPFVNKINGNSSYINSGKYQNIQKTVKSLSAGTTNDAKQQSRSKLNSSEFAAYNHYQRRINHAQFTKKHANRGETIPQETRHRGRYHDTVQRNSNTFKHYDINNAAPIRQRPVVAVDQMSETYGPRGNHNRSHSFHEVIPIKTTYQLQATHPVSIGYQNNNNMFSNRISNVDTNIDIPFGPERNNNQPLQGINPSVIRRVDMPRTGIPNSKGTISQSVSRNNFHSPQNIFKELFPEADVSYRYTPTFTKTSNYLKNPDWFSSFFNL